MITLNDYFSKVIWIGSVNRPDRAAQMEEQLARYKITAERFEAHWKPIDHNGRPSGNAGCTASHRGVHEIIGHMQYDKALIFEDDNTFVDGWEEQFDAMIREVPNTWQFLYLGGHYAEKPIARVSESVIRCGAMLTTSSYAVRWQTSRAIAPSLCGVGPIDNLVSGFLTKMESYILDPRICYQRASFSDLTDRESNNGPCMLDDSHSRMV